MTDYCLKTVNDNYKQMKRGDDEVIDTSTILDDSADSQTVK